MTFLMGACRVPKIGKKIEEFSFSDLVWGERLFENLEQPFWAYSGDGSGFGDGSYGNGYDDGSGSGDGSNYGYGSSLLTKALIARKKQ